MGILDTLGGRSQGNGNRLTNATHAAYEGARQQNAMFVAWLRSEKLATLESRVAAQTAQDAVSGDMVWGPGQPSQIDAPSAQTSQSGGMAATSAPLDSADSPVDDEWEGDPMQNEPAGGEVAGSWLEPPTHGDEAGQNEDAEPQIGESWIDNFWGGESA